MKTCKIASIFTKIQLSSDFDHLTHRVMSLGPVLGRSVSLHANTIIQFDIKQFIGAGHVLSSTWPTATIFFVGWCP